MPAGNRRFLSNFPKNPIGNRAFLASFLESEVAKTVFSLAFLKGSSGNVSVGLGSLESLRRLLIAPQVLKNPVQKTKSSRRI